MALASFTAPSPGTSCAPTCTLTPGRRYSFDCRYRLGTASNLVMYVSAADNDYAGVTGTFLGTASQGVWSTAHLDFSAPPGGIAKLHFGAFGGSIPGLVQQSAGTLDLYSMQIRASAFEGELVSATDLLADSLALTGSATLDGLTAQGNVGCDQLLCNDVNCTDVFTTGVDASGAVSCAALTATGTVAGATLTSDVPVDTSPTVVKFPALAVLLMVSVLPVIPVAELSRPTLAAPVMLSCHGLRKPACWTSCANLGTRIDIPLKLRRKNPALNAQRNTCGSVATERFI